LSSPEEAATHLPSGTTRDGSSPVGFEGGGAPSDTQRYLPTGDEAGTAPGDRVFRPDVEGLRAVAITLVVLLHAGVPHLYGGTVGVDAFFVISGFVITGLLLREQRAVDRISFLHFYARRARRILPMAILVIVVTMVAIDVLADHSNAVAAASDGRWSALFLANLHFINVDPDILVLRQSPFGQYWSLAVEEQFYLLYPAFFVLIMAIPGRWPTGRRLALGLAGVASVSFVTSVLTSRFGQLDAYYSPGTRVWELAVGGLVAVGTPYLKKIPVRLATVMTWAGLVGLVTVAYFLTVRIPYPGYAAAAPVACVAVIIAGGTVAPRWGAELLLGSLVFRWVGRWSYSWYLWHLAIIVIAAEAANELSGQLSVGERLALAVLALVVAAASYFLIENPIRHSVRIAQSPGATLAGAVLLIGSCVAFTYLF
jgi:peptidoglycan/LPS O-acetylase OafA/YrhL